MGLSSLPIVVAQNDVQTEHELIRMNDRLVYPSQAPSVSTKNDISNLMRPLLIRGKWEKINQRQTVPRISNTLPQTRDRKCPKRALGLLL